MKINKYKTKEMMICFCKRKEHHEAISNISINGTDVERVATARVLGVTLTDDLSWNAHIDNIISKAAKRLYMLYQLKRSVVAQEDLLTIYTTVIRPVM